MKLSGTFGCNRFMKMLFVSLRAASLQRQNSEMIASQSSTLRGESPKTTPNSEGNSFLNQIELGFRFQVTGSTCATMQTTTTFIELSPYSQEAITVY